MNEVDIPSSDLESRRETLIRQVYAIDAELLARRVDASRSQRVLDRMSHELTMQPRLPTGLTD